MSAQDGFDTFLSQLRPTPAPASVIAQAQAAAHAIQAAHAAKVARAAQGMDPIRAAKAAMVAHEIANQPAWLTALQNPAHPLAGQMLPMIESPMHAFGGTVEQAQLLSGTIPPIGGYAHALGVRRTSPGRNGSDSFHNPTLSAGLQVEAEAAMITAELVDDKVKGLDDEDVAKRDSAQEWLTDWLRGKMDMIMPFYVLVNARNSTTSAEARLRLCIILCAAFVDKLWDFCESQVRLRSLLNQNWRMKKDLDADGNSTILGLDLQIWRSRTIIAEECLGDDGKRIRSTINQILDMLDASPRDSNAIASKITVIMDACSNLPCYERPK